MADLDVQPKKRGSILPWILLGLGLLALLFFLARGCNDNDADDAAVTTDSLSNSASNAANNTAATVRNWWDDVDFNAPTARYDEIRGNDVEVRGNDRYGIYSVNETVLFDEGKSTIRSQAENTLKQIAGSIGQRYSGSSVRVYGHTDATGSAGSNKELAEQRAEAVRAWLAKNGNMSEGNISVHPVGESQPTASNATEQGRQKNRRVEIVAGGGSAGGAGNGATATDSGSTR
jgi:outer membrane protein OmpA-like peptidoglycan-associated protein